MQFNFVKYVLDGINNMMVILNEKIHCVNNGYLIL